MLKLVSRDLEILREVERWRFCLSRQIYDFTSFKSKSAFYRRLKLLVDHGYLTKKRYLYGLPAIYTVTIQAYKELAIPVKNNKVSVGILEHELAVIDCYLYFKDKYKLESNAFQSERELRNEFTSSKHYPDIVFKKEDNDYCIEVEFSLKSPNSLERNIKENYLNYEEQFWIIKKEHYRLNKLLEGLKQSYPNIKIILWEQIEV